MTAGSASRTLRADKDRFTAFGASGSSLSVRVWPAVEGARPRYRRAYPGYADLSVMTTAKVGDTPWTSTGPLVRAAVDPDHLRLPDLTCPERRYGEMDPLYLLRPGQAVWPTAVVERALGVGPVDR